MYRTACIAKSLAAAVCAALALSAAATAGGPVISAGAGCSVSCIQSAVVTPTASSASVEIRTTVPASVTVTVAKLDAQLGLAAGPVRRDIVVPPFQTIRTVLIPGLEPETTYRIVVSARDVQGHVQTRSGTFTTRAVKIAVDLPDVGLSAGLGCSADCIEKGTLTSDASVPGRARLELSSTVPATYQVSLVVKTVSGTTLHFFQHVTGSRKTEHTATFDGLLTGTTYQVTAKATDSAGHAWIEQGTFRTRSARAVVTFHKVKITDDGDKGANRGEIALDYRVAGNYVTGSDFHHYSSGDTVVPKMPGTSRPGYTTTVSIDRQKSLELAVGGLECDDAVFISNCVREAGGNDWTAIARTAIELRRAFAPADGLPPGHGTGLPAGHDLYAIFETTDNELKFRVYATVDFQVS
jgi:hypothetical protein